jgi:hypothetical protein
VKEIKKGFKSKAFIRGRRFSSSLQRYRRFC